MLTVTKETDPDNWRAIAHQAAETLLKGEVVALPTETVYGLAACAFDPSALAKVFEAKNRPEFDPLIVHLGDPKDLVRVAKIPEEFQEIVSQLTREFWPGPLTLVLPKTTEVPDLATAGLETVAVRLSAHEIMREVARTAGPLAAPSANRFGRISPTSALAVKQELDGRIPLIIDGGACRDGLESTIVKPVATPSGVHLSLLRPGPVSLEQLRKIAKVKKVAATAGSQLEAPGMLSSHYAPATPLLMFDHPEDFVPEPEKRYGLLSFRGDPRDGYLDAFPWNQVETLSPGKGKLQEAAVRLFYSLRQLDSADLDAIVAEPVSTVGIGLAIMNRLSRAAHNLT